MKWEELNKIIFSLKAKDVIYKGPSEPERHPTLEEDMIALQSCMLYQHKEAKGKQYNVFECDGEELIKIPKEKLHFCVSGVLENERRYLMIIKKNRLSLGENEGRIIGCYIR